MLPGDRTADPHAPANPHFTPIRGPEEGTPSDLVILTAPTDDRRRGAVARHGARATLDIHARGGCRRPAT